MILYSDAYKKGKIWAETAKDNEVIDYRKEIINFGKEIRVIFEVDSIGESYVILKNDSWTYDTSRLDNLSMEPEWEYRELRFECEDKDLEIMSVDEFIHTFDNYKIGYKQHKIEQDTKYKEYLKQKNEEKKRKKRETAFLTDLNY